jgi:hypothetical protein
MVAIRISIKIPSSVFSTAGLVAAIEQAMKDKTAPHLKDLFGKTVQGWQNPPQWGEEQQTTQDRISMKVYATGNNADQYGLVNFGSPPHSIYPKNPGGFLRFQPGYRPSTSPGSLNSRAFLRSGSFISAQSVAHPGFEARRFDETVAKEYEPMFQKDMQDAIGSYAKLNAGKP